MASVARAALDVTASSSIPDMSTDDLQTQLRRDVAMHRAAQILADADRCRRGLPTQGLSAMRPMDAMWYRQTARQLIEIFEAITQEREPVTDGEKDRARREAALAMERSRARVAALKLGHDLDVWRPVPGTFGEQTTCRHCDRDVRISPNRDEPMAGTALEEPCVRDMTEVR